MKKLDRKHAMARPIPELDLRNLSARDLPKDDNILDIEAVNRRPKKSTTHLLFGAFSGWISGVVVTKLSKISAFGLGGGVILLYFASELGYIKVNWDRIMEAVSHTQDKINSVHDFARRNSCFSVGFVGGFFFGMSMISKIEEISSLDIYEKRKRLRRLKYLTNRENKSTVSPKTEVKKVQDSGRNIITPDKMKTEIYKELTRIKVNIDDESSGTDSDYAEDEIEEYKSIITQYGKCTRNLEAQDNSNKAEFLAIFKLATQAQYKEKILDRQERILRKDAVVSAYIAAGRLDCISIEEPSKENKENKENHNYSYKERKVILEENTSNQKIKQSFLTNLHLTRVTEKSKADYEAIWEEIVKERKRRGHPMKTNSSLKLPKLEKSLSEIDTNDQLQILTEIKKHVTDNNNLIKKRIDSFCCNGESIKILAEKNISELSRLSKMADRSVKLFSGQDTKKRDLNPGFDSENIQGTCKFYPDINIPNVSKIISLKSEQTTCTVLSAPATSMDEPSNCAAGVDDVPHVELQRTQDFACQVDEPASWPGVDALVKMYKEHDIARKKEMAELHKRNTQLRVESAHITRAASRDSDRARHLLTERRNLASEEHTVRTSLQWLYSIVDLVRNYEEKKC
ncbi:uncharacterized protein LOC121731483 [Aricia agestis]|uniref:uncharacterized protein LOC121731483 n=1 Tax=Aricia agestis TaxID=91739 RepID=UPI001C20BE44|nr:uncharacterized protein LOC121731483 [Aricia agestis]